ncbi:Oidioi.mRNA.OKI2018_I69.chr1.g150.t1.cds [Oikopleura dioica]|uniref:Oidioi.mRNA.OKI2018_I69.chr1.g150.t1.cds n=1 Tax=Oikopleura dioica TaxID=34765 RepID=A0ABN7SP50_OIKDI|nr:Oidioi.mRNA.OKI2018_I69.chr1.g150.t1.cds [Oikopleura dioica]
MEKLAVFIFFVDEVFGRKSGAKGTTGGAGSEDISLNLNSDDGTFADFLTGLEFIAAVCVAVGTVWIFIVINQIRKMPMKHECPFDFSKLQDPIDRCQDLRYILSQSKLRLPERKKAHKKILYKLWGENDLIDKSEIHNVMAHPEQEFAFVRKSMMEIMKNKDTKYNHLLVVSFYPRNFYESTSFGEGLTKTIEDEKRMAKKRTNIFSTSKKLLKKFDAYSPSKESFIFTHSLLWDNGFVNIEKFRADGQAYSSYSDDDDYEYNIPYAPIFLAIVNNFEEVGDACLDNNDMRDFIKIVNGYFGETFKHFQIAGKFNWQMEIIDDHQNNTCTRKNPVPIENNDGRDLMRALIKNQTNPPEMRENDDVYRLIRKETNSEIWNVLLNEVTVGEAKNLLESFKNEQECPIVLYISSHGYYDAQGKKICLSHGDISLNKLINILHDDVPKIIFADNCYGKNSDYTENAWRRKKDEREQDSEDREKSPKAPTTSPPTLPKDPATPTDKPPVIGGSPAAGGAGSALPKRNQNKNDRKEMTEIPNQEINEEKPVEPECSPSPEIPPNTIIIHASPFQTSAHQDDGSIFLKALNESIVLASKDKKLDILKLSFVIARKMAEEPAVKYPCENFAPMCETEVNLKKKLILDTTIKNSTKN